MIRRKSLFMIIALLASVLFTSCNVMKTVWGSVKERYKAYEFVGTEGDKVLVKFVFDSPSANTVWLAGQFNNWANGEGLTEYPQLELSQGALINLSIDEATGYWTIVLPLAPGRYQFKYVLDAGRVWAPDENTEHVDDGFGGKNSIIVVVAPTK